MSSNDAYVYGTAATWDEWHQGGPIMTTISQTNGAPIQAPRIGAHEACNPALSVRIVKLTSYRFLDDSKWTMREFDYRLRWTLYADHDQIRDAAHAHVTVEVWSRRDAEWHQVWEFSREGTASPYEVKWQPKVANWNAMLDELATYATQVLL